MTTKSSTNNPSDQDRERLNEVHRSLLAVHKDLIDFERGRYERQHGRIATPGDALRLLIGDPWFAWLRPLTALITQIDEFVSSKEPSKRGEAEALVTQSKRLLTPDENGPPFQLEYFRALQESPEVAAAHGQWKLTLQKVTR